MNKKTDKFFFKKSDSSSRLLCRDSRLEGSEAPRGVGIVGKFPCQIILLHSSVQTTNLVLFKCTNLEDFLLIDTQIQSVKNLLNPGIKSEYLW